MTAVPADGTDRELVESLADRTRRLAASTGGLVWALDFDGTLVDLAPHPDRVHVPSDLVPLLRRLQATPGYRVVILTGRAPAAVDHLLGSPGLVPIIGNHGADVLAPGSRPPASWADALQRLAASWPGTWLEDKGPSLAFHWREAKDPAGAEAAVRAWARRHSHPAYRWRMGRHVLDIVPRGADKGAALVAWLTARMGLRWRSWGLVAVGDDATDEDLFRVVEPRGLSILVGTRAPTLARQRLPNPTAVRRWLADLTRRPRA
jgi:trehalose 6-phosphate phosphatase